ncbi:MAG: outer membrane lipoprotein carrier protein LolA [Sphingobacteriia bacterium]|nr:outer membrane lipoprotein carrier protein LolA [Sphingobacteriia bacterium]
MKIKLGFVILIMFMASAMSGQDYGKEINPEAGFKSRLKEYSERTKSIEAAFSQVKTMAVLSSAIDSKGMFYYVSGEGIAMEYSIPQGDLMIMNSEKFKMVNGGKVTTVGLTSNPLMRQLNQMLTACFLGDLKMFEKGSDVNYYESESTYTVVIKPSSSRVKKYMSEVLLVFDKRDMTLTQMRMKEKNGDEVTYKFWDKKINKQIAVGRFKI